MKKSKVVLILACAVLLVAASIMGTMAYLTSQATVTNTFTVGNVTLGGTNEAGLDEAKTNESGQPVDASGNGVAVANAPRVTSNSYKLQPGHTYTKDPTIHVGDNSDDCYLFVKVENGISAIEDTGANGNTIAAQMTAKGWKALSTTDTTYADVYVYVGTETGATAPKAVSKSTDVVVFEQFKVGNSVTGTQLADYASKTIKVTAYAVQVDGFEGKSATDIWDAAFATGTTT